MEATEDVRAASAEADAAFAAGDARRRLIRGRIAYWLRRSAEGSWEITLLMNSHSYRPEPRS